MARRVLGRSKVLKNTGLFLKCGRRMAAARPTGVLRPQTRRGGAPMDRQASPGVPGKNPRQTAEIGSHSFVGQKQTTPRWVQGTDMGATRASLLYNFEFFFSMTPRVGLRSSQPNVRLSGIGRMSVGNAALSSSVARMDSKSSSKDAGAAPASSELIFKFYNSKLELRAAFPTYIRPIPLKRTFG